MTIPSKVGQHPPSGEPGLRLTLLPDPPQIPDMATQISDIGRALFALQDHFLTRDDVVVMSNGYLCLNAGSVRGSPYPDLLVSFGIPAPAEDIVDANGYTISEIGKPPDFVLEVASASTGRRDYTDKREIYAGYGVAEYWRFDRTGGRFHDAALAGDRLLPHGSYQPLPVQSTADGVVRGHSTVLGLELRWVTGTLRFWDPATGEYLPDLTEAKAQRDAALERVSQLEEDLRRLRE